MHLTNLLVRVGVEALERHSLQFGEHCDVVIIRLGDRPDL
jgi:hypothetical protein